MLHLKCFAFFRANNAANEYFAITENIHMKDLMHTEKPLPQQRSSVSSLSLVIVFFLFLLGVNQVVHSAMTVTGPITASSVTVSGDVSISSMTVSSLTVTNLLNVTGSYSGISGRVVQMKSTTTTTSTLVILTTNYMPVLGMAQSITLSDANNYVRISLSGTLAVGTTGYLTIFRDSTNLGDPNSGLAATVGQTVFGETVSGSGITITDSPGDTNSHTYQPYIRVDSDSALYPYETKGYLILEEISR